MLRFRGVLNRIGVVRHVDVPPRVSRALGGAKRISVRGTVNGEPFRCTLVPRGDGAHRVAVHSRIWRALGVDAGDKITVELEADDAPIEPRVPTDFQRALDRNAEAAEALARKTPRARREIVRWIESAKAQATRDKRIEISMDLLGERR